jgi:hypothetical protein
VSARPQALEHGSTRPGRWLRARRLWIALSLAALEGVLVVADVIPGWIALVVAVAVIGVYLVAGRSARWDTLRQASWIAAASQVCVALVPVLVAVAAALALIAVVVLAVVALVALLADRR